MNMPIIEERKTYNFKSALWLFRGEKKSWFVVTIPPSMSREIRFKTMDRAAGWGTVKADAKIGGSEWTTGMYLNGASACYFLPVHDEVREKEGLTRGTEVECSIEIDVD